jgi:VCBS repeat-containing protein
VGIGWDEDTSAYSLLSDAVPTGVSYMLFDDWGGTWSDVEKRPDVTQDDLLCWAAAASNALEWSTWGVTDGMEDSGDFFQYFQDHWTPLGGFMEYAWDWWFDGEFVPPMDYSGSVVDVPGGGFYPTVDFLDYYQDQEDPTLAMSSVDDFLHEGYCTTLAIYTDDGFGAHAITCWGFNYNLSDPTDYLGIWVTDSDDDKDRTDAPDRLRYYQVSYDEEVGSWYLQDYYGAYDWSIGIVQALGRGIWVSDLDVTTPQDTPIDSQVIGRDPEGDTLEFYVQDDPEHGSVLMNTNGSFTYTPALGYFGPDFFTFMASDPGGDESNLGTVNIVVDDPPVAQDLDVSTDEDVAVAGQVLSTDIQPQEPVYSVDTDVTHGVLVLNPDGSFTYTPDADFNGTDQFTFIANDGLLDSLPATVSITVAPVNDVPVADGQTLAALYDYNIGGLGTSTTLGGTDVETDSADFSATIVGAPAHGSYTLDGLTLVYMPEAGFSGTDTIQFTLTDTGDPIDGDLGWGLDAPATSDPATITVHVPVREDFAPDGSFQSDADEGQVRMNLRGAGEGWVYTFEGITGWPMTIAQVVIADSGTNTTLIIQTTGDVTIGGIMVPDGPMNSILARTADLQGNVDLPAGGLRRIQFRGASGGVMTVNNAGDRAGMTAMFGQMDGFGIRTTGNVQMLQAGSMVDSYALAGVYDWSEGDGLPDPYTQIDTPTAMGGAGGEATIARTVIRGLTDNGWYVDNFVNSSISAFNVGTVLIRNADSDNGGHAFGVSAWEAARISYLGRDRSTNWSWPNRTGAILASDGDLALRLGFAGVDSFGSAERVLRDRAGDAGFPYADITDVGLRVASGRVDIAVKTSLPIEDIFSQAVAIRVWIDTKTDFDNILTDNDFRSDYCLDWLLEEDQLILYTGGGYLGTADWQTVNWRIGDDAYATVTDGGVVLSVPLIRLGGSDELDPTYQYVRIVGVEIWKGTGVSDAVG